MSDEDAEREEDLRAEREEDLRAAKEEADQLWARLMDSASAHAVQEGAFFRRLIELADKELEQ